MRATYTSAQRAALLKRAEALIARGASIQSAALCAGVKYSTLYTWRLRFNGLSEAGLDRLRSLEKENARLRRALLELEPRHDAPRRLKITA